MLPVPGVLPHTDSDRNLPLKRKKKTRESRSEPYKVEQWLNEYVLLQEKLRHKQSSPCIFLRLRPLQGYANGVNPLHA